MSNKPFQFSPLHFHQTVSEDGRKGYAISAIGSDFTICDMNLSNLPPEAVSQILPHMQLFTAAPELLEVLQEACYYLSVCQGSSSEKLYSNVCAAIAKATGTTA